MRLRDTQLVPVGLLALFVAPVRLFSTDRGTLAWRPVHGQELFLVV